MKRIIFALAAVLAFFYCEPASAVVDLVGSYDYYVTPNEGNNYNDGQGFTLGFQHDICGNLKGRFEASHMTDIQFPVVDDPKGSFGELRGYGATYSIVYELPYSDRLTFAIFAGAGPFLWDFRENPFLQDNRVKVDVDPSIILKAGAEARWKIKDGWTVTASAGWFDTEIKKVARDDKGMEWNILDGENRIGLQYIPVRLVASKKW